MSGLSDYIVEKAQSKTGLSTSVLVGYALQGFFGIGVAILFFVAVFFVFADYFGFGATATSIGMLLAFVLFFGGAMVWTNSAKKKTVEDAERALEANSFVNAPFLQAGMQLGQKVGWKRAIPALIAVFAVSGVATEWARRNQGHSGDANY